MKKSFLFIVCIVSMIFAQDLIVLVNGDIIEASVEKVGIDVITYKKWNIEGGPDYDIEKSKVFLIKYENGNKDTFGGVEHSEKSEQPKIEEPAVITTIDLNDINKVSAHSRSNHYFNRKMKITDTENCHNTFFASLKYQQYVGPYDYNAFVIEAGGINKNGFTIHGVLSFGSVSDYYYDYYDYYDDFHLGMFIFLGATTLSSNMVRFKYGADLGYSYFGGRGNDLYLFGGPHISLLVGNNPLFGSISMKALFGMESRDDYSYDYYSYRYNDSGYYFLAMFSWNIGVTVSF